MGIVQWLCLIPGQYNYIVSIFFSHHFFGIGGPEGANFVASWANIGGFPIMG